jgi:hypothetical protein
MMMELNFFQQIACKIRAYFANIEMKLCSKREHIDCLKCEINPCYIIYKHILKGLDEEDKYPDNTKGVNNGKK